MRRIPDGGGGSIEVHDDLAVGSTVTTSGPRNAFPLTVPGFGSPDGNSGSSPAASASRRSCRCWPGGTTRRRLVDGLHRPQPRQPAIRRRGRPLRRQGRDPHRRPSGAFRPRRTYSASAPTARRSTPAGPRRCSPPSGHGWPDARTSNCTSNGSPRPRCSTAPNSRSPSPPGATVRVGADETLLSALRRAKVSPPVLLPAGVLRHLPHPGARRRRGTP